MIYIAHRGAPVLARENSLPSFELALKAGLNWFELDVHLSKDGQLIVHHDYAFTRTAGDNREIGGLTLEEIKKINICKGTDQPFCFAPTLEQVFGVLPETVTVNVEIKNEQGRYLGIEQAVAAFAKTHRPERIAVSNQTYPSLIKMREIAPELRLGLLA
ncbi:MAG: glycerophosphodiester phosphodiesterase family protein, partial [Elusimicrobiaceae bacterium]